MTYSPWEICQTSWRYKAVWPRWWKVVGKEIALSKGDRFPPAYWVGNVWQLVRATK